MRLTRIKKHWSTAAAVFALALGFGLAQPAAAQADAQAPVYWTFMNGTFDQGHCLTGGQKNADGTGKAYMSWCNGGFQQQWDWRGSDSTHPQYLLLQNRATGLCLATDAKSNVKRRLDQRMRMEVGYALPIRIQRRRKFRKSDRQSHPLERRQLHPAEARGIGRCVRWVRGRRLGLGPFSHLIRGRYRS
ncbi:hypothetical protein [Streptomyces capparidis]